MTRTPQRFVLIILAAVLALVVVAARLAPRIGEPLLVAVVVALPTPWFTALATLAAIVPLVRTPRPEPGITT